ncbi:zinc transporter ZIP1 [Erythrolamprus reginae]|uniref:zinc transporter ZIP1 n=1 Tax=Erythrolamprus reginae TaxID=121349 RepID=UPI00396C550C
MAESWESDAKVVWNPYETISHSVQGLELKAGVFGATAVGDSALCLRPALAVPETRVCPQQWSFAPQRKTLSLVSCFAGGVFLGTCLLDLLPNYLASINEALDDLRVTLRFPLQEFILAMGFFIVLVLEQIVLTYKDPTGSLEESEALLNSASQRRSSLQPEGSQRPLARDGPPGERTHVHVDFNAHSAIRLVALFLALSLHSVFEGLAVGLQEQGAQALEICLALLIHKGAIAFSLSLKLLQGRLRPRVVAICLVLFSVMSPLGIGLGGGSDRGPPGRSVPPLPRRPGRLSDGNLLLRHVFGDSAPRTRLFRATDPEGHHSPAWVHSGHQRRLCEVLSGGGGCGAGGEKKPRSPPRCREWEATSATLPTPPYGVLPNLFPQCAVFRCQKNDSRPILANLRLADRPSPPLLKNQTPSISGPSTKPAKSIPEERNGRLPRDGISTTLR